MPRSWFLKTILQLKGLEEVTDSRAGTGKLQSELEMSYSVRRRGSVPERVGEVENTQESASERVPNGQSWNTWSNKMNNDCIRL